MSYSILALCGGVGGAKLIQGLSEIIAPEELCIVVNTGDDFQHLGLHISPDLDTVMYTLAGVADKDKGWGVADESWHVMAALSDFAGLTWFNLGDKDLGTHLFRTKARHNGMPLDAITTALLRAFGLAHRVIPMTNGPLRTQVNTTDGQLSFQDYFVRLGCLPKVKSIEFSGRDDAPPHPAFLSLVTAETPQAIILCPSNPFVSIDPILSLPGIRRGLGHTLAPVVAVSPIIGGRALRGPAAKIMGEMGLPVNNVSIARHYQDFLDGLVIDHSDSHELDDIERLGMGVHITKTRMQSIEDKIELARTTIAFANAL